MIITAHLLVGAAVASKTQNPVLGLFFAFLSHYFLDFIPHREYILFPKSPVRKPLELSLIKYLEIIIDFSIGLSILLFLSKNKILALSGGFFGILPDLDSFAFIFPVLLKNKLFKIVFDFHLNPVHIFENKKIPLFWRIFSQVLVILIAIYFLRLP